MAGIDDWLLAWVDVGDDHVCPDCKERREMEPRKLSKWVEIGLPGAGYTRCNQRCRCLFLPEQLMNIIPTFRGKTIKLRDKNDRLKISREIDIKLYTELDELVGKYEKFTDNWNLPESYYQVGDVVDRISFMKKLINQVQSDSIPPAMFKQILVTNPQLRRGKVR